MRKNISIVIPVYNCEKTISRTIDSIKDQINDNIDVVFVNDGSKDNSQQIIESFISNYTSNSIKLINQENRGLVQARKTGIFSAEGEYIVNLDGGDALSNNALEVIGKEINNSHCDYYVINNLVNFGLGKIEKRNRDEIYINGVNNLLLGKCPYSICFKIVKKGFFINSDVFDKAKGVTNGEDFCFSLDLMLKTENGKLINDYLYIYNKDIGSMTDNNNKANFLKAIDYANYKLGGGLYKEEKDYLIFSKTIQSIVIDKNKNGNKELYDYYKKSNIADNKYIKLKSLFEILATVKVKMG